MSAQHPAKTCLQLQGMQLHQSTTHVQHVCNVQSEGLADMQFLLEQGQNLHMQQQRDVLLPERINTVQPCTTMVQVRNIGAANQQAEYALHW
jgi:hypothetical protein